MHLVLPPSWNEELFCVALDCDIYAGSRTCARCRVTPTDRPWSEGGGADFLSAPLRA